MLNFLVQVAEAASTANKIAGSVEDRALTTVSETTGGLTSFFGMMWDKIPYFFAAIIVMMVAYFIAKYARRATEKALMRTSQNPGSMDLIGKSAQGGVLVIGLVVSLEIMNIDLSLILGAFGFGIGFALKDIIANYLAGILILVQEPFKVDEIIEVNGTIGKVQAIEARNIIMRNLNGQRVIVSNTDIFNSQIKNYTHHPERRVTIKLGVDYSSDLPKVMNVLKIMLDDNTLILRKPAPKVIFTNFADSAIRLEIRFWVSILDNWVRVKSNMITQIKHEFDKNGILIPFPTQIIRTANGEPFVAEVAQINEAFHKEHSVTGAIGSEKKVPTAGATDSFDPRLLNHQSRKAEDDKKVDQSNDFDELKNDASGDAVFDAEAAKPSVENSDVVKTQPVEPKDNDTPLFV
ncbi:MAG: mechanosensitive ion channel [Patescibacteria group bacterium]|nr:mechanosensitive ion channel [Patescibacteria group bacterium]